MPQNTFLAVIILSATVPLYQHYASLKNAWPGWTATALDDQHLAAGIMWVGGDLLFIAALGAVVWGLDARREANTERADRRADAELAVIRSREAALAERRADESELGQGLTTEPGFCRIAITARARRAIRAIRRPLAQFLTYPDAARIWRCPHNPCRTARVSVVSVRDRNGLCSHEKQ